MGLGTFIEQILLNLLRARKWPGNREMNKIDLVPALKKGTFQRHEESFSSKCYIVGRNGIKKRTVYHISVFHCAVSTTKIRNTLWLAMQRNVPTQDNSESSNPESITKEQNPGMFTKEEHEPHELAKGTDLGVPVLTVGRGSSQFSSPPRTTLDIHIGDGMIIPRVVWTITGYINMTTEAVFHITNKNQDWD